MNWSMVLKKIWLLGSEHPTHFLMLQGKEVTFYMTPSTVVPSSSKNRQQHY